VERIAFLVGEAQKEEVKILPPDINSSFASFIPENGNIRFGLLAVKNVGANIVEAIINERQKGGPFQNFTDFLNRVRHKDLNKKSLESLAKVGVFDSLEIDRVYLLNNMDEVLAFSQNLRKNANSSQASLFGSSQLTPSFLKNIPAAANEAESNKEKLSWEKELLGFYLSGHPLSQYREKLERNNIKPIKELAKETKEYPPGGNGWRIAGVIIKINKIISKTGQPILFAKLEDMSDNLEVIVFADAINKNPDIWRENNIIVVSGRLSSRNGEKKLICQQAIELS
jgi:DNA polymerase-3 subunit alpha